LPPPSPPPPAINKAARNSSQHSTQTPTINFRVLGYAFFETAWGKGYATEACTALIDAYKSSLQTQSTHTHKKPVLNYIEACLHPDNVGSIRVLEKLGFERVRWGDEPEPVFYAGKWREPGYWVYGMYV
jgi:RimJ/RimL family protein N-acetyltransferase